MLGLTPRNSRDQAKTNQVVVITGASAGVGRATARAFAERGARLALLARGSDGLRAARDEVERLGGQAITREVDTADAEAVDEAAADVERVLGPIDVWVNNAMTSVFSPVWTMTADEYRRVTEVTYLGYVHGTLAALRRMLPRDRGVIVQVGSALAYRSIPLQSAYCAAKHAIVGFTDSLRSELIHEQSGVRVTAVDLPGVNTPQFRWVRTKLPREAQPVGAVFQPEVAARAIVWAADHDRREVSVGTPAVLAILGQKLVPGVMDHYLARSAWEGQMTNEPVPEGRADNLFEPVPGDHGAHGVFDRRARDVSYQFWMDTHRGWIAAAGAALGVVAAALVARSERRQP